MGPNYEKIQTKLFSIDEAKEAEHIEKELLIEDDAKRTDISFLVLQLDRAEDNSRRAHRLYVNANVTWTMYDKELDIVGSQLRERATKALEAETKAGIRDKRITEADVDAATTRLFTEQVRELTERRAKAKAMVEHFLWLAKCWDQRCRDLNTMVNTARR